MSNVIASPFSVFFDRSGQPLDNGYIYIGTAGINPETSPITVYWDLSLAVTAAQPIRTLAGYPSRDGSPSAIVINQIAYSIVVRDRTGALVFSDLNVLTDAAAFAETVADVPALRQLNATTTSTQVMLKSNYVSGDGGGVFRYDNTDTTSADNNGTIIVDAAARRWKRNRVSDTYFLRDFGPIGSGSDLSTLTLAIASAKADGRRLDCHGRTLVMPATGLRVALSAGETLRLTDLRLDLSAIATSQALTSSWSSKFGAGFVAEQSTGVDMWNGSYNVTLLTAAASRGGVGLAVAELSSFTVGDEIIIRDATRVWDADGSICSEGATIIAKSAATGAGTLTLAGNLRSSYTTSATVRRWISANIDIDGVDLVGGGVGADQDGMWIWGMSGARLRNVAVAALENRGLVVANCRRAFVDNMTATRCAKNGLGYGIATNGSDRVQITNLDGSNCRHLFTSGKGPGGSTMQSMIEISNVSADGMQDAVVDAHPGVYAMTANNLLSRGAANAGTSGDGLILFQGTHLSASNARQVGPCRRHAIVVEQFGHLDETGGSRFQFSNCVTEASTQAVTNYGFIFNDASCVAANGFTGNTTSNTQTIELAACDMRSRSGTSILASTNTINDVRVMGGAHRSLGPAQNGHGFLAQASSAGSIQRVAAIGTTFESNGGAGFAAYFQQGRAAAQITGHVAGCASRGAQQWGFRVDEGTLTYAPLDAVGFTTSATVAGTGGTLTAY